MDRVSVIDSFTAKVTFVNPVTTLTLVQPLGYEATFKIFDHLPLQFKINLSSLFDYAGFLLSYVVRHYNRPAWQLIMCAKPGVMVPEQIQQSTQTC